MKRVVSLLLLFSFVFIETVQTVAQTTAPASVKTGPNAWKAVDSLIDLQYYNQAYQKADALYADAKQRGDSRQSLVGAQYLSRIGAMYKENNTDTSLARYQALLPTLQPIDKAVCRVLLAEFYSDYYVGNRWRLQSEGNSDEASLDYKLWSAQRLKDTVVSLLQAALNDTVLLMNSADTDLGALATVTFGDHVDLTPTVFDVLVRKAVSVATQMDCDLLRLEDIDNPELLYAESERFVGVTVRDGDASRKLALMIFNALQQRERMHLRNQRGDGMMMTLYQYRIPLLQQIVNLTSMHANEVYQSQLALVISRYRHSGDQVTQLYYDMAQMLEREGRYVEAVATIDTALALYPKSPGGVECYNLRLKIMRKNIQTSVMNKVPSMEPQLALVTFRNVNHLYFRVVKNVNLDQPRDEEALRKHLLEQKVLHQWDQPVGPFDDYRVHYAYAVMPPMTQGEYLLLVSDKADFSTEGISMVQFEVVDIMFLDDRSSGGCQRGFVVERTTGRPVADLAVTLQAQKSPRSTFHDLVTVHTDKNGYYDFSPYVKKNWNTIGKSYNQRVVTTYKGYRTTYISGGEFDKDTVVTPPLKDSYRFFLDRPVYKPGDTVFFAHLQYRNNRTDGFVVPGGEKTFFLVDINGKTLDTLRLNGDEYGLCEGRFVLSADAMPGIWKIRSDMGHYDYETFRVEAYKQPKFTVTLSVPAEEHRFGQAARFEGVAASYSAVPISGAKVAYAVTRSEIRPVWWWGWNRRWRATETRMVAGGEVTTAADGTFTIDFVPEPDSNADFSRRPAFVYTVNATVTDINGETHMATASMRVGYVNSYAEINVEEKNDDDVSFRVVCRNLDGSVIGGSASIEVSRLTTPAKPKLTHPLISQGYLADTAAMPIGRKDFERLFPLFDYDGAANDMEGWPVAKRIFTKQVNTTSENPFSYSLKGQPEGVYRMKAFVRTASGDTLTVERCLLYQPTASRQPVSSALLTASVDKSECLVGDSVTLRVGSRFDDVTCFVLVNKDKVSYRHELHGVSHGFVDIKIPVTDELLGGVTIEVAAVKANQMKIERFNINVPYAHKKLDVVFETFRNKLEPGSKERWTLRVSESLTGQPSAANLLMTMYDHALDNYGILDYSIRTWFSSFAYDAFVSRNNTCSGYYRLEPLLQYLAPMYYYNRYSTLKPIIEDRYIHRQYVMYKTATARGESDMVVMEDALESKAVNRNIVEPESAVNSVVAAVAGVGYADAGDMVEEEEEQIFLMAEYDESSDNGESVQIRQNLNTLAFFRPTMRSASDGSVELAFTVPDLLTEWSISGLAWTKDLKVGKVSGKAITQKRLMVTPNVPRFLRHGDTCLFSVKVSNLSGKEQQIAVTLEMTNADGGEPLPMLVDGASRSITLKDGASGEVCFALAVPRAPVFVTNYKVIARGDGVSDGEQAAIPLLPSRQLVTESMAFYINGAGEKTFVMKHLAERDTTQEAMEALRYVSRGLTVELTPNPIWMAIQTLPYVARQQNPSNIYLANAIYANSLSFDIVKNNPQIEQVFREWEKNDPDAFQSELDRNADLKQTVMEATPWLQDAISEEQRHHDVAHYFNRASLSRQLQKDIDQLMAAQRSDGGWSWIDGGRYTSLYTTQYILKTFGQLRQQGVELDKKVMRMLNKAMDYVDKETYDYYRKYIKDHGYDVVNLDYLYLRSLYADNKLSKKQAEAYNFFYNNAKKYNKSYQGLYTQALLSYVFNRGGDKKLAREMAVRIREKALYNDEMGMYWRDNTSGWRWSERPIETQAMLIRTFAEVLGDDGESITKMQQWLLKQKQTTNWETDVATVNAIQALLVSGQQPAKKRQKETTQAQPTTVGSLKIRNSDMGVAFGNHQLQTDTTRLQLHVSQRLKGDEVTPADGRLTVRKGDAGIAWGAMYWQYFEQVDKIPAISMGITLKQTVYAVATDGRLTPVGSDATLHVGDRVRVRLEISCDRNMEYIELTMPRHAGFEPVNTASGWRWNSGLSYYAAVTNTATTLYIDRIDKGQYVVEVDFFANNAGTFTTAPTVMQCLYAPEFRALSPAPRLEILR